MAEYPNKSQSSYRKTSKFHESRFKLKPGVKGFFCTCHSREKDSTKEAINLLREYSEEKYVSFILSNPIYVIL